LLLLVDDPLISMHFGVKMIHKKLIGLIQ